MEQNQISVALVGLSFGLEFLPIYLEHPDVKEVWIVEKTNPCSNSHRNAMESQQKGAPRHTRLFWKTPKSTPFIL